MTPNLACAPNDSAAIKVGEVDAMQGLSRIVAERRCANALLMS